MAKIKKFEYRHINNKDKFLHADLLNRYSVSQLRVIAEGIRNDVQIIDSDKKDLLMNISNKMVKKYENTVNKSIKKEDLDLLKKVVKNDLILKGDDRENLLKIIRRQQNENMRQINQKRRLENEKNKSNVKLHNNEKKDDKLNEEQNENDKDKRLIESSSKLGFTKKQRQEIAANYLRGKDFRNFSFDQWTKEEKQINDHIRKIRNEIEDCSDQEKVLDLQKEILKYKCQMKTCLKYGEKALDKEILEEEKLKNIDKQKNDEKLENAQKLKRNSACSKENQIVQNDIQVDDEIKKQIETIINAGAQENSVQKKSSKDTKTVRPKIPGLTEEQMNQLFDINFPTFVDQGDLKKENQDETIIKVGTTDSIENNNDEKAKPSKQEEEKRKAEIKAKIEAEVKAKIEAEEKEIIRKAMIKAKIDSEVKFKIEAEEKARKEAEEEARLEAEENANIKKGLWKRIKEKVSRNFKKIVGPVLAALTLGGSTQGVINAPQMNSNDTNLKNPIETMQTTNNEITNKIYPEKFEDIEKNLFIDSLKVDEKLNQEMTLGDIVYIDEGCNYYENSLEGGNHNIVDTKNQWRSAGKYLIDGLAVTYQDNEGNWKIAKSINDESNGGNYEDLGLNSKDYVQKIMKENGLTQEQVRVMYHINMGTVSGEHPTGWIEVPKEGFQVDSRYENQQESEIER